MINKRVERFINIQDSYSYLISFFNESTQPAIERKTQDKKIIAVGGAKGGIGKSIIATNLGVLLSSMGKETIIADFDLGGANLHLYLGESYLNKSINDYLNKNVVDKKIHTSD